MAAKLGPGPIMAAIFGPTGQNVAAIFGPTMPYYVRPRTKCRIFCPVGPNMAAIFGQDQMWQRHFVRDEMFQFININICMHFFIKVTENMITQLIGQAHLV